MNMKTISAETIKKFEKNLRDNEKSENTIEKYIRDVTAFAAYYGETEITKEKVIAYKRHLTDDGYAVKSINSMLASINSLFAFLGCHELRVKTLKLQKEIFRPEEKELTRAEYERLCHTAKRKKSDRLFMILQTICSTGIRISELQFITVEAVEKGEATVTLKGKTRTVIIPKDMRQKLLRYTAEQKIKSGMVFVTKTHKAINRTNVWREMKALCCEADVNEEKVFPHNLRHLFARVFYNIEKDIAKLADVLGHSSINTTRLYIITTCTEHRKQLERMKLTV